MKKIILGLCLLCFATLGLQSEALAHNSHGHNKNQEHYSTRHKKVKKHRNKSYNRVAHHKVVRKRVKHYDYYTPRRVAYRYHAPVYVQPVRQISYYEPNYFGFGYSNYSSGFHINLGFD